MNPTAKSFDLANALACVGASADAYRAVVRVSPPGGSAYAAAPGGGTGPTRAARTDLADIGTDTHASIFAGSDAIIIAFRGSVGIRNWITDADFARVGLGAGAAGAGGMREVHRGFEAALASVLGELVHALGGAPRAGDVRAPIFLTGHSLGGALAVLAALELQGKGFRIAGVYTFGQPRVGNAAYQRGYDAALGDRTFRLVYQEDIVPRIPHLPALHDRYRHVGQEVFISSLKPPTRVEELWFNPPLWRVLLSDAWGLYRACTVCQFAGALDPIHDHHINHYRMALASIAGAKAPDGDPTTAPGSASAKATEDKEDKGDKEDKEDSGPTADAKSDAEIAVEQNWL